MITATMDALSTYLADPIEVVERSAATVLPPNGADEVHWIEGGDDPVVDIETRLAASRRCQDVDRPLPGTLEPTLDAIDEFLRLSSVWLANAKPGRSPHFAA